MIDKNDLKIIKKAYGLGVSDVYMFKRLFNSKESELDRSLNPFIDSDIVLEILTEIGVKSAEVDQYETMKKYGEQLVWEGEEFKNSGKRKSGNAILERLKLKRNNKEG